MKASPSLHRVSRTSTSSTDFPVLLGGYYHSSIHDFSSQSQRDSHADSQSYFLQHQKAIGRTDSLMPLPKTSKPPFSFSISLQSYSPSLTSNSPYFNFSTNTGELGSIPALIGLKAWDRGKPWDDWGWEEVGSDDDAL
jgi:hypothetical protein